MEFAVTGYGVGEAKWCRGPCHDPETVAGEAYVFALAEDFDAQLRELANRTGLRKERVPVVV